MALLLAGWAAGEVSRAVLHAPDLAVVRDLAAQRTALLSAIARALSWAGSVFVIAPLAVALCTALYRRGRRAPAAGLALSSAGAALIFNVEKLIVGRPRPPVEHLEAAVHSSFPSGHATLSAAFYLALVTLFLARRPLRPAAIAWATAAALLVVGIALSRVYLGVHYPTDVTAGVVLGGAWTLFVLAGSRAIGARGGKDRFSAERGPI